MHVTAIWNMGQSFCWASYSVSCRKDPKGRHGAVWRPINFSLLCSIEREARLSYICKSTVCVTIHSKSLFTNFVQALSIHLTNLEVLRLSWCSCITDGGLLGMEPDSSVTNAESDEAGLLQQLKLSTRLWDKPELPWYFNIMQAAIVCIKISVELVSIRRHQRPARIQRDCVCLLQKHSFLRESIALITDTRA